MKQSVTSGMKIVCVSLFMLGLTALGYLWCRQAPFTQFVLQHIPFLQEDPHLYVVIPTYNNEEWCIKNLESLKGQRYPAWSAIVLNDCSTDRTSSLIRAYIDEHELQNRITLIDNKARCGACRNIYDAINGSDNPELHLLPACPDRYVVVLCDGDDWFATPDALGRIAVAYRDPAVWLTYGQYRVYPTNWIGHCAPYPLDVVRARAFRSYKPGAWMASHLRTFRAGLFKKIHKEDLMVGGEFLTVTWDVAMMAPMLELATPEGTSGGPDEVHFRCIEDVLYVYNTATPLNDYKQHFELQQRMDRYLRAKPKYAPLTTEEITW